MKLKKLSTALALVAVLASGIAFAGYSHEIMNPEATPPVAAASLPTGCRLLADDITNQKPIFIDCDEVAGLNPSPIAGSFSTLAATGQSTLSGAVVGDGGDTLRGFKHLQVAASATALTIAQCGATVVSAGAAVQPLPEASTALGCQYTFVCGTADDFDIDPADGTDAIGSVSTTNGSTAVVTLAPSAGDEIRCTDIGGSITLEAVGADLWAQVGGGNGIWTDVN
jgi:hypothetical protein